MYCRYGLCVWGVLNVLQSWCVTGVPCATGMGYVVVLHVLQAWGVWVYYMFSRHGVYGSIKCAAGMGCVGCYMCYRHGHVGLLLVLQAWFVWVYRVCAGMGYVVV